MPFVGDDAWGQGVGFRGLAQIRCGSTSLSCFGTEYLDTEYSIPKYSAPR